MFRVAIDWNPKQQKLREALSNKDRFSEAIQLCLELHGIVHSSFVSAGASLSFFDEAYKGLNNDVFYTALEKINGFGRKATIAWNIWHITRIEDITTNILVTDGQQVFNKAWQERLNTTVTDTGNAMSDDEIISFSHFLDPETLREYRNAVGLRTREILRDLTPQDLKRKFKTESIDRILHEGGVVKDKKSAWLLDFWGRKNVAGILLMPVTRHQIVHLNECIKIKNKLLK